MFLDTNIIMNDYKMEKQKFSDFLKVHEELNTDDNFKLFLTEMNLHEVIEHYTKDVNSVIKQLKEFSGRLNKVSNIEIQGFDRKTIKSSLIEDYKTKIEEMFYIHKPTGDVYENAISRFYETKMPFRDNKAEFKDAVVWETVADYANSNPDERIYFISDNHKDFAVEKEDATYVLHNDFDDEDGRIKYFKSINEFLKEIEHLKIHDFSFQEVQEILELIKNYLDTNAQFDDAIDLELHSFFSNNHFSEDFYEGWGTDYVITEVSNVILDENREVLEHEEFFYIPIISEVKIEYAVETKNPVYEGEDDDEFIQSKAKEEEFLLTSLIHFNATTKEVEKIEEVEIDYL
ncbi:PIN domain-containing protein [Paenisporosarcina sp.]|uniref:PIN domain-containing protein n=1 Tax=Paenisporosarcina sp. TaxID=1932001 RepID=UPI003C773027